ncbi:Oleuropein beta-glucosidase [Sesamum alatum]|uniref:Oleuropein beta-glucosidase n=1 Tax=Sesamum alatum TaxID=300844 RepID=A0AAE1XNR4_9LAMI|nr:Oleuropein beta-glucosidase [Sesamum alatum]
MAKNGAASQVSRYANAKLTRHDFPPDFIFGAATSCYQVEGAYAQGGKSLNNWDVFALQRPGKILGGTNGCVAIDHYNRFKEDVALMKKLGLDSYRFSISWSRVLPGGRLSGGINREGIQFYNDLINLLLAQGIEPCVTIFHFDVPQCLEEEYGGFLCSKIQDDFAEFAELCFFEFGDRVKFWITQNEPITFTKNGYVQGSFPPGHGSTAAQPGEKNAVGIRCARGVDTTCHGGDAGTEPYIVAHNLILAHAKAVDIYRRNYQGVQGGKIGITNMSGWFDPYSDAPADVDAAARAVDFMWGWFTAPIVTGDYPPVMRERVKDRLPTFKPEEVDLAGSDWLFIVPYGIRNLLVHTKDKYNDPIIYITENGVDEKNDWTQTITSALKDDVRIKYIQDHLAFSKEAMDLGVKLKGYFAWSLFDNYEWTEGYTVRFGMYYVDYVNGYTRYPKKSAIWYMNFLNKNIIPRPKRQIEEIEDDNIAAKRSKRSR